MIKKILRVLLQTVVGLVFIGCCLLVCVGLAWLGEKFGIYNVLGVFAVLLFAYIMGAVILD